MTHRSGTCRTGLAGVSRAFWIMMVLICSNQLSADDWPGWGGPQRDLVWRETGIVKTLPAGDRLPRLWSTPIGEGYAGPAVADGRVYVTDFVNREGNALRRSAALIIRAV